MQNILRLAAFVLLLVFCPTSEARDGPYSRAVMAAYSGDPVAGWVLGKDDPWPQRDLPQRPEEFSQSDPWAELAHILDAMIRRGGFGHLEP